MFRFLSALVLIAVAVQYPFPVGVPQGFRTELNRLNAVTAPYTGALVFKLHENGILTGEYESDSIRPDPLYGQRIPVTGTISGTHIRLQIGTGVHAIAINGTVNEQNISGSVMRRDGVWTFKAVRVHLQNPPEKT